MSRNIYKNSLILMVLRFMDPMLSMVVVIAMSRIMGPESLGTYSFVITFTAMFAAVSQMGLHSLLVREVANNKEKASIYLSNAIFIGICTSGIVIAILNLSKGYFNLTTEVSRSIFVMSLSILPTFAIYSFESFFLAFERINLIFFITLMSTAIRVTTSLILILLGYGLLQLILAILITSIISVTICFIIFNKYIAKIVYKIDFDTLLSLLKNSPSFLLISIVAMLSSRIDVLMLTKLTDMIQVAIYSVAYKLFEMNMVLPQAYMRASFPQLSRLFKSDMHGFEEMIKDILKHMTYFVLITGSISFGLASLFIYILYGEKFAHSAIILQVLIIGIIFWGLARVFAYVFTVSNLQKYDLMANIIATAFNIILNLILIPRYGGLGAAIANSSSLFLFCMLELWYVRMKIYNISIIEIIKRPIVVAGIVLVAIWVAKINWRFALFEFVILTLVVTFYFKIKGNFKQAVRVPVTFIKDIMKS